MLLIISLKRFFLTSPSRSLSFNLAVASAFNKDVMYNTTDVRMKISKKVKPKYEAK